MQSSRGVSHGFGLHARSSSQKDKILVSFFFWDVPYFYNFAVAPLEEIIDKVNVILAE